MSQEQIKEAIESKNRQCKIFGSCGNSSICNGKGLIDRPTWDVSPPNDGSDIPCPDYQPEEPKCKTCDDTGYIHNYPLSSGRYCEPCPDCRTDQAMAVSAQTKEPEAGEFTKDVRINFTTHFENPDWVIHKKLIEACDIIDRQAAELKKLIEDLDAECRVSQMLLAEQKKLQAELKKLKK